MLRELDPIPPRVLRLVKRNVRALHECFDVVVASRSTHDADTHRERNRFAQPPSMAEVTSLDRHFAILRDRRGFVHAITR